jgi:nucleotide-binding universal stress UspA family protein
MYSKILVPIDGSKSADDALDHAVNLVKSVSNANTNNNTKTQLMILFVIPELPIPLGFEKPMRSLKTGEMVSLSDYVKEMHEAMKSNALRILSERKEKYESDVSSNAEIKTQVVVDGLSIADTIIDFANKEKTDLIVVGNVGLSGMSKVKALGSVSRAVVEKSICPILVVHYKGSPTQ